MILTREDLHRRVWARPMRRVAHDLGVTAAGLRRICKILDVPFPYSGYWRGDAPLDGLPRTLPRARPGHPGALKLDLPVSTPSPPAPAAAADPGAEDPRPDAPAGPSSAAIAVSPAPGHDAGARPTEPVTPQDLLDRRWDLVLARLVEALERAGHKARIDDGRRGFDVKGQFVTYRLREGYSRTKRPLTAAEARDPWKFARGGDHAYEHRMTGRLILAVRTKAYGAEVEWRDQARRGRLEDRIDEIVAGIEALAEETTRADAERREAHARWQEAEARRRAAEGRARADAERWQRLCRLAAQHENTRRVAAFLKRLRAETGPAVGGDPVLRAWFAWTEHALDAYDPATWNLAQVMRQVDRPPRTRSLLEEDDDEDGDDAEDDT